MATDKAQVWAYCEENADEPEALFVARQVALELGADPITPATGALLQTLAATQGSRAVLEVGTGAGVSGLWLLHGMDADGVLTTIDPEAKFQRAARQSFQEADIAPHRSRFINSRALDVLPRLADLAYDMAIIDGLPEETHLYVEHAARLLRIGGILVIPNALWFGNVANPAKRDPHTVMMREVVNALQESPSFMVSILPVGNGVTIALKQ